MLGVTTNPCEWPADHVLRAIADEMGQAETFQPTPVGVFFGQPGQEGQEMPDPFFAGEGPTRRACQHCGACIAACQTGEHCAGGSCQCLPGLTDCGGTCSDTRSDALHCGSSCAPCAAGEVCSLGACTDSCDAGLTQCANSCVDTNASVQHCGACGNACGAGESCSGT